MQTLLKYDIPVRFDEDGCPKAQLQSESMTMKPCGPALNVCQITKDEAIQNALDQFFEPVVYKEMGTKWIKRVSRKQSTPIEIRNLGSEVDRVLSNRCSRKTPICAIRREVLDDLINEVLRQIVIECPEQGILFKRVVDHYKTEFKGYETVLRFAEGFIGRKRVAWQHIKAERQRQIMELENTKRTLEYQVMELKQKADHLEKKNQEAKLKRDQARSEEIKFYKRRGEQLKAQADSSVLPNK